jgi:hypothetical protein
LGFYNSAEKKELTVSFERVNYSFENSGSNDAFRE